MSKQVHCPECNSENTPGSKFCNHCGGRLPKSTSVLCPRCQSPNPHNNFYCDNCGGRLQAEQAGIAPVEGEPEQEAGDLPTSAKMFSLPTRDPGDTGELDPSSLPDWLKGQGDGSEKRENTDKLPRLSDLTPDERSAKADLPGWLIDTENEGILSGSPDDITTEHFLHLIQDINEEEREKLSGLLNDPSMAGDAANLPDWLKDAAQPKQESSPVAEEEPSSQELDDVPDWLGDIGPVKTSLLGNVADEDVLASVDDVDDELPDWLTGELDSVETAVPTQESDNIFSDADIFEDDVPDWMLSDQAQDETPSPDDMLDDLTLDAAASVSLTGWLAEFDEGEDEGEETAVTAEDLELPEISDISELPDIPETVQDPVDEIEGEPKRSLTDWLTVFDEDDLIPEDEPATEADSVEEALPDWLAGIDEAKEEAHATTPDDVVVAETPEVDDSFDWLTDEIANDTPLEETPAESVAKEFDWFDSDVTDDDSLSVGNTGPLPDWLDELTPDSETPKQVDSSELDSTLDDLFGGGTKIDATGDLEWLSETGFDDLETDSESETDDASFAPLVGAIGAAALAGAISQDDDVEDTDSALLDDNPDWLSELAGFGLDEPIEESEPEDIVAEETAVIESLPEEPAVISEFAIDDIVFDEETDFDVDSILSEIESEDVDDLELDDELLGVDAQTAGDWADIDGILAGSTDDDTLPDWLEQLEDVDLDESVIEEGEEEPPEEIPQWVADLRPGEVEDANSVLPSALFTESDASEILSDTGDLSEADMPDWLDSTIQKRTVAAEQEVAGWMDTDGVMEDAPAELEAILADLPPAQAPEDMLLKAEIPDWLEEMKPRELTGEAVPLTESRLESSGPLAGMPHTIPIEPIIAMPRTATTMSAYGVSAEQVQQSRLLRQLVQEGAQPPQMAKPAFGARGVTSLRIIVAVLVLVAIFLGLYGPGFLQSEMPTAVPVAATAVNTAVSDVAGRTVLVAFEYSPALAGELDAEAAVLLAQLDAAGSPMLVTSQYVAGTAIAEAMTAPYDAITLGLIPGEAMGLRQLGNCLGKNAPVSPCISLNNLVIGEALADALADVSLIIVLTGERSSVINWVEQVGVSSDVPIVIGATQALEPIVVPYYASAQVSGYLNGLPATMAYQQAYMPLPDATTETLYGAQSLVLLVTAVILLIGGFAFGFAKKKS